MRKATMGRASTLMADTTICLPASSTVQPQHHPSTSRPRGISALPSWCTTKLWIALVMEML